MLLKPLDFVILPFRLFIKDDKRGTFDGVMSSEFI